MRPRIIHIWLEDGREEIFAFWVLPEGVEFEYCGFDYFGYRGEDAPDSMTGTEWPA